MGAEGEFEWDLYVIGKPPSERFPLDKGKVTIGCDKLPPFLLDPAKTAKEIYRTCRFLPISFRDYQTSG